MTEVTKEQIRTSDLATGIASGQGLAVRSIMLDTIQRYYAANPQGTPTEKLEAVKNIAMDAARAHKDGVTVAFMNLTLNPAQKELAGMGWGKLLGSKKPEDVVAFLDDPELKQLVNSLPIISQQTANQLTERAKKEGVSEKDLKEIQERADAGSGGLPVGSLIRLATGTFENVAAKHNIMYHTDDKGVKWELGNSFQAAIEAVKKDLGKVSGIGVSERVAVVDTSKCTSGLGESALNASLNIMKGFGIATFGKVVPLNPLPVMDVCISAHEHKNAPTTPAKPVGAEEKLR